MGLAVNGIKVALATRDHFWEFETVSPTQQAAAATRLLVPRAIRWTGRLDAHDVAFDRRGSLFANTGFNCVSRPSERVQFKRVWQPAFMRESSKTAKMTKADCCHLNGIGVRAGQLAMATAFCERAELAAWRAIDRFQSGVLIDVGSDEVVVRGLCLPHSPRWHAGRWWLCDSGRGRLCLVEAGGEACESVIELPGFTRGLTFFGDRAVIGLSRIRQRHILDAPPVRDRWRRLRSGLSLVDWRRGVETGALEFVRGGREVYDVTFLPGVTEAAFAADAVGG
jgi:uncharacterized protein (TIGR03032 family)